MENTKSEHGWSLPARSSQSRRGGKTQYTIAVVTPARLASTKSETQVLWGSQNSMGLLLIKSLLGKGTKRTQAGPLKGKAILEKGHF